MRRRAFSYPPCFWLKRVFLPLRPPQGARWSLKSAVQPTNERRSARTCLLRDVSTADRLWCSEEFRPHSASVTLGVLLQPTGGAGAASCADGQEAQSPRPASAAQRGGAAAAAAALADGDAQAAPHPRALAIAATAAVQAQEPEGRAEPQDHAERAAPVAAAPTAAQESGPHDAGDAPGRGLLLHGHADDTAPASQPADQGGAEPASNGAAAAGAPQGAEAAGPRSPAAATLPPDCHPDQPQAPAEGLGGSGEAAASGAGAKRGREEDVGVAAHTEGALPSTEAAAGLADDAAAAAAHKRARLGEGPRGDGGALGAGGAPPGHVSYGVPAPVARNGATP